MTYRALTSGKSNKSSDAGNDGGGPVRNGVALSGSGGYGYIWPSTGVASGQMTTKTYQIPASWIASGRVSFMVQDDTAVVKATLTATICCVTPTQPEK